jgi:hypothetical protein
MQNILTDIWAAVKLAGKVRKARKNGESISQVHSLPLINPAPAYYNTIEGCLMRKVGRDVDQAFKKVFRSLPYEVQRKLEFSPKEPGEWAERAQFWRQHLKSVLPPEMYYLIISTILKWYIHYLRNRAGQVPRSFGCNPVKIGRVVFSRCHVEKT